MGQLCSCHSGKARRPKGLRSSWCNLFPKSTQLPASLDAKRNKRDGTTELQNHDNLPVLQNAIKPLLTLTKSCEKSLLVSSQACESAKRNGVTGTGKESDVQPPSLGDGGRSLSSAELMLRKRSFYRLNRWTGGKSLQLSDELDNICDEIPTTAWLRKKRRTQHSKSVEIPRRSEDPWGRDRLIDGTKEWLCSRLDPWILFQWLQDFRKIDASLAAELGRCVGKVMSCQCLLDFGCSASVGEQPDVEQPNFGLIRQVLRSHENERLSPVLEFLDVIDSLLRLSDSIRNEVSRNRMPHFERCFHSEETTLPSRNINTPLTDLHTPSKELNTPSEDLNTLSNDLNTTITKLSTPLKSHNNESLRDLSTPSNKLNSPAKGLNTPTKELKTLLDLTTPCSELTTLTSTDMYTPSTDAGTPFSNSAKTLSNDERVRDSYFRSEIVFTGETKPCLYEIGHGSVDRDSFPAVERQESFSWRRHSALCHSEELPNLSTIPSKGDIPSIAISMCNVELSPDLLNQLTRLLVEHSHVRSLSIVRTRVPGSSFAELFQVFHRQSPGILHFDFRMNQVLDGDSMDQLLFGLRCATALNSLNLSSTGLCGEACRRLVAALGTSSATNRVLAELDLGYNEIEDAGCCAVAELIEMPGCWLRKLRLRHNGIGFVGVQRLAAALCGHPRLTLLDVSSNAIGNDGAASLLESLLGNRTLRDVALDDCGISAEGCSYMSRALTTNSVLRSLTLSRNPFGDLGVRSLAEGLRYNRTLEVLGIDMCCLGNEGFVCLLQELRWCHSMRVVKACYNFISISPDSIWSGGCRRWSSASQQMSRGTSSNVSATQSKTEVYVQLCDVLRVNPKLKIFLWGNKIHDDVISASTTGSRLHDDVTSASTTGSRLHDDVTSALGKLSSTLVNRLEGDVTSALVSSLDDDVTSALANNLNGDVTSVLRNRLNDDCACASALKVEPNGIACRPSLTAADSGYGTLN